MARGKKKATRRAGKKKAQKKGGFKRLSPAERARRAKIKNTNIKKRAELVRAAALLDDFHGGRSPVKSGCGRPRGS